MRRILIVAFLAVPVAVRAADPVAFLPANTDVVLTVNARQIAESDLGKKLGSQLLKELLSASPAATAAVTATGLDPLKDFDVITVGVNLDQTDVIKPFALFEGKFDAKKVDTAVAAYLKAHPEKLTAITVGGKPGYKIAGKQPTDAMFAAIIDDTKLVVAPTEKDLAGAFAAAAGERKPVISKELGNLLATARSPAPVFARGWVKGKFGDLKVGSDKLQAAVRGVEWATAAVTITRDVSLTLVVSAPDAESAERLSNLLGALVGGFRLQLLVLVEDQPELKPISDLLKATKVAPVGKTVVATGSVKGEAIEKALTPPPAPKPIPKPVPKKK